MARVIAVEPSNPTQAQRSTESSTYLGQTLTSQQTSQSLSRQQESITEAQRIMRETASTVGQARVQTAQAEAQGGGGLAGLINVGVQLADRFGTIEARRLEREAKRAEAREKALKQQAEAEKEAKRQAQLTEIESLSNTMVLAQGENGTKTTLNGIRSLLNDPKFSDITDEDRREMERRFQSAIRDGQEDILRKVERTQDETSRARFKAVEYEVLLQAGGRLSALKYDDNPTTQRSTIESLLNEAEAQGRSNNLSELDLLNLRSSILEAASKSTSLADTTRAQLNNEREQLSLAFQEVTTLTTQRARGEIPEDAYQVALADVYAKYPAARGYDLPTLENTQDRALNQAQFTAKMRTLAQEEYEFEHAMPVLSNQVIAAQALEVVLDPSARVRFEVFDTGDNQRVLELADTLRGHKETLNRLTQGTELRKLDAEAKAALLKMQSIEKYRANPQLLLDLKDTPGATPPDTSDEAYQKAQLTYQTAIQEYQAQAYSISQIQQELARYGVVYDQASGQLGLDASVQAEVQRVMSTPTSTPPPQASSGGGGFDPQTNPLGQFGGIGSGFSQGGGSGVVSAPPGATSLPGAAAAMGDAAAALGIAQLSPPVPPLKSEMKGNAGTVKLVPAASSVFRGHFIDNSPVGSYDFTLIDKQDNDITALPSPVTGTVTESGTRGGYGNVIAVQDASTGKEWFIAHLHAPPTLRVGDTVVVGQQLGVQGSSGNSTGPHVHLEIYDRPWKQGGTRVTNRGVTQPLVEEYLNRATTGNWPSTLAPSLGLPPTQGLGPLPAPFSSGRVPTFKPKEVAPPPPGSIVIPGGGHIHQGQLYLPSMDRTEPVQATFNSSRPLNMPSTSKHRRDYPAKNDPTANYGYSTIAQDAPFRNALVGVADRLNIPAQWLADVMAFESFYDGRPHNPRATNSQGAVGLIQFYPGSGLAEVAREMGVSESVARDRLLGMSAAQQMKYVESHIRRELGYAKAQGVDRGISTIGDLLALVFGGHGLYMQDPDRRGGVGDGAITFQGYIGRLGEHAGRRYQTGRGGKPTHTTFHSNCPTCQNMMQNQGYITAHAAP